MHSRFHAEIVLFLASRLQKYRQCVREEQHSCTNAPLGINVLSAEQALVLGIV